MLDLLTIPVTVFSRFYKMEDSDLKASESTDLSSPHIKENEILASYYERDKKLRKELAQKIYEIMSNENLFSPLSWVLDEGEENDIKDCHYYTNLVEFYLCHKSFPKNYPYRIVHHVFTNNGIPVDGMAFMSCNKYDEDKESIADIKSVSTQHAYSLGQGVFHKILSQDSSTTTALKDIYEVEKTSDTYCSGHRLAKLSDLPAYRHNPSKHFRCDLCSNCSYTYCVQCTLFLGFPEISAICKHCEVKHAEAGYIRSRNRTPPKPRGLGKRKTKRVV